MRRESALVNVHHYLLIETNLQCYKRNVTARDTEIVKCLRKKDARGLMSMQRLMENDRLYFWNFLAGEPFMYRDESIADFKEYAVVFPSVFCF